MGGAGVWGGRCSWRGTSTRGSLSSRHGVTSSYVYLTSLVEALLYLHNRFWGQAALLLLLISQAL